MNKWYLIFVIVLVIACKEEESEVSPQEIIDESILASGGIHYKEKNISFTFRDMMYTSTITEGKKVLTRSSKSDSVHILDIKSAKGFERYVNDSLVMVTDSMANVYSNAINSVHYFAYLPYGLNDAAVNKNYLGKVRINDVNYHKIEVTFDQEGGGDDYDDIYVYWFNMDTNKLDYLAYEFHVNGGGQRFRKAFNERTVNGIRFVDYQNFKSTRLNQSIQSIDSLYQNESLELLSEIKLEEIKVSQDSYN
jgi:hypothetical protein